MPFRIKQQLPVYGGCAPVEVRSKILDNGKVDFVARKSNEVLPSVENYKLAALVKAGVSLEKVSTKILDDKKYFEISEVENNEE